MLTLLGQFHVPIKKQTEICLALVFNHSKRNLFQHKKQDIPKRDGFSSLLLLFMFIWSFLNAVNILQHSRPSENPMNNFYGISNDERNIEKQLKSSKLICHHIIQDERFMYLVVIVLLFSRHPYIIIHLFSIWNPLSFPYEQFSLRKERAKFVCSIQQIHITYPDNRLFTWFFTLTSFEGIVCLQ